MGQVKPSIVHLFLVILLGTGLTAQDKTLYILHTNNTNGALENCYCPDHPFGAVEKRVVFVENFLEDHPNAIPTKLAHLLFLCFKYLLPLETD